MSGLLSQSPPKYYALLLTFEGSHLVNDVEYMAKVMRDSLKWEVVEQVLPTTNSTDAQAKLDDALTEIKARVKHDRVNIVVYYGGHATLQDSLSRSEWRWNSAPKDGYPVCMDHMLKVDPENFLSEIMHMRNDTFLIFHSPFVQSLFPSPGTGSRPAARGNVQVLAMKEMESGTMASSALCIDQTCENNFCVACPLPASTGRSASRALIGYLESQLNVRGHVKLDALLGELTESTGDIDLSKPGSSCLLTPSEAGASGQSDDGSSAVASSAAASGVQRFILDTIPVCMSIRGARGDFVLKKLKADGREASPLENEP